MKRGNDKKRNQHAFGVGNHREEGDVKTLIRRRVLSVLVVSA